MIKHLYLSILTSTLFSFSLPAFSLQDITDTDWRPINNRLINISKYNGETSALAVDSSGNLYAGGSYGILKWNGAAWVELGEGVGGSVDAIACDKGGNIYAGGGFSRYGNIARWDGTGWSALGSGARGGVRALAVDNTGNVYAGGSFDSIGGVLSRKVALWDGAEWIALDSGIIHEEPFGRPCEGVFALVYDNNAEILYAGGDFNFKGGSSIAKWDGTDWREEGDISGAGDVQTLAFDSHGNLYAGGFIYTSGSGTTGYNLLIRKGTVWSGCDGGTNLATTALAADNSGNMYVAGEFYAVGQNDLSANFFAKYNTETGWTKLDSGITVMEAVNALAVNREGRLFAGGEIQKEYTSPITAYVYEFRENRWRDFTGHTRVNVLEFDKEKNLVAGGDFTTIGDIAANNVALWDGSRWSTLGSGVDGVSVIPHLGARVNSIAFDNDGNLYVGGEFQTAGGIEAQNVAKWDGSSWSSLGEGVRGSWVNALAFDSSGNLIAGGNFDTAGTIAARNIAKWDGSEWSALGSGMPQGVNAIACGRGELYAGGETDNGNATVARWDGDYWHQIGTGLYKAYVGSVSALALDSSGHLYAGGSFSADMGHSIAMWDGSSWSSLGYGLSTSNDNGVVTSILVRSQNEIYAGGFFFTSGLDSMRCIARWDGTGWSRLGSGANNSVLSLAILDTLLFVGGAFDSAGGKGCSAVAQLNLNGKTPVFVQKILEPGFVSDVHYRVSGSSIVFTNIAAGDEVRIYSADGSLLKRSRGVSFIDLGNFAHGLLVIHISRERKLVSAGRVLRR